MKLSVNEAKLTGLRCRLQALGGGGGGGGGEAVFKKFFSALLASVWSENKVEGEGGGGLPWICHWVFEQSARNCATIQQVLILKFAIGPEKSPGLSRNGALITDPSNQHPV